tara:strand:- start:2805 stop:3620 length:816 start_codon:yes stop_codon:yes gene_type:complete
MRIAICLYGSFDNMGEIYPYFYKTFIKPNINHIIEIYIAKSYHHGININYYYTVFGHYLKNVIYIENRIDESNPYFYHKARLLNHKKGIENAHNIKYDIIILHNIDNVFVKWDIYGDRTITIDNLPIGYTNFVDTINTRSIDHDYLSPIKLNKLDKNTLICYEDYYCGYTINDFFICSSKICDYILEFYNNFSKYGPVISLGLDENDNKKINSIHSYDAHYNNLNWWLYCDIPIQSIERQLRFNLARGDINIKQLRFSQNLAISQFRSDIY